MGDEQVMKIVIEVVGDGQVRIERQGIDPVVAMGLLVVAQQMFLRQMGGKGVSDARRIVVPEMRG